MVRAWRETARKRARGQSHPSAPTCHRSRPDPSPDVARPCGVVYQRQPPVGGVRRNSGMGVAESKIRGGRVGHRVGHTHTRRFFWIDPHAHSNGEKCGSTRRWCGRGRAGCIGSVVKHDRGAYFPLFFVSLSNYKLTINYIPQEYAKAVDCFHTALAVRPDVRLPPRWGVLFLTSAGSY